MKRKSLIIAGVITVGLVPLAIWMYRKAMEIDVTPVSEEWIASAEYNREGFRD